MPVKYKGIKIIFGIYTRCQQIGCLFLLFVAGVLERNVFSKLRLVDEYLLIYKT